MDARAKRRTARDEVRRDAMSKDAAKDTIQILSAYDRPPSFRQLFSPSHSSLSVTDDVRHSEVVHVASNNVIPPKPPGLVARHALKVVGTSKHASGDVKEFLNQTEATDSFRWLFPRFQSSSSLSCASLSSFHTCTQDEQVLHTDDDDIGDEGSQILQESELQGASSPAIILSGVDEITSILDNTTNEITAVSREGSQMQQFELHSPVITLVEVDATSSSNNIIINEELTAVEREQGGVEAGASEANQLVARRRGWLGRWRKGSQEPSKLSSAEQAHVVKTDIAMEVPKLSLAKLKEKTDNFGVKYLIGEGSYGRVYCAVLDDGKQVAVKRLNDSLYLGSESKDIAQIEEKFLTKLSRVLTLRHENIVQMLGCWVEGNYGIMAYEFATRGSLHETLHGRVGTVNAQPGPVLSWMQRVKIAVDVAKGLEFLHEKVQPSIIHGHIRSSNVLLFEAYKAKIMDLSISNQSTYIDENMHEILIRVPNCSYDYFPKESYFAKPAEASKDPLYYHNSQVSKQTTYNRLTYNWLTKEIDVYSFGVVLLELLTGQKPGRGQGSLVTWAIPLLTEDKVKKLVDPRLNGEYPPKGVAKLAAVAALCVQYEPEFRPNMRIVVKALSSLLVQKPAASAPR